ncbi:MULTISPECIES: sensor histidine kinase [Aphanothece]|uniref:sensor histidine kinase n=1 Tax=Aphanothece TaxID=1121 RepID=UPI0039851D81
MSTQSLRVWLQSGLVLAVLAGYGLLLLLNQAVARQQRQSAHQQLVAGLAANLQERLDAGESWAHLREVTPIPGLELELLADPVPEHPAAPWLEQRGVDTWMVSRVPLSLPQGRAGELVVAQDISLSLLGEQLAFWVTVIGAGTSTLITSSLMRLVLRQGLVQPLRHFTRLLDAIQPPPAQLQLIRLQEQPVELRPIAHAFNRMQTRLLDSWEHERLFVDGVAHELRTPLTLISGHVERLQRQLATTPQEAELRLIRTEADRMVRMVKDLLDLARHDGNRLSLACREIVGEEALLAVFERMMSVAPGRLRLQGPSPENDPPATGFGDPERLEQCLICLVDNALRYSPSSSSVTLACEPAAGGGLLLHVLDRGPGVAPAERDLIFGRFVRGSAAAAAGARSNGIGLALAKTLIEAMGGTVRVVGRPGGGADFQLELPPPVRTWVAPPAA